MQRFFFDRLVNPELPEPMDDAGKLAQLRGSINEELQRLVSGRSWFAGLQRANVGQKSILNWGIDNPVDFGNNMTDLKTLMDQILDAVKTFEPRIREPKARMLPSPDKLKPAQIQIYGYIQVGSASEAYQHVFATHSG